MIKHTTLKRILDNFIIISFIFSCFFIQIGLLNNLNFYFFNFNLFIFILLLLSLNSNNNKVLYYISFIFGFLNGIFSNFHFLFHIILFIFWIKIILFLKKKLRPELTIIRLLFFSISSFSIFLFLYYLSLFILSKIGFYQNFILDISLIIQFLFSLIFYLILFFIFKPHIKVDYYEFFPKKT